MNLGIFDDLWIRRHLVWHMAVIDLKTRYKNSVLGFAWSLIEPLLILTILYLVFTNIFKTDIENYAIFLLIGIITWNMFYRATSMNTTSIINKANVITKFYFPREIFILSTTITAFFMMLFELIVLGIFFCCNTSFTTHFFSTIHSINCTSFYNDTGSFFTAFRSQCSL